MFDDNSEVSFKGPSGSLLTEQTHSRKAGRRPASDKLHSSVTSHHYAIQLLHRTAQHHRGALWSTHTEISFSLLRYFYKHVFYCFCFFLGHFFALTISVTDDRSFMFEETCHNLISNLCLWHVKSAARQVKTTKTEEEQVTQVGNIFESIRENKQEEIASWQVF